MSEGACEQVSQATLGGHLVGGALAPGEVDAQRQQHVRGARAARAARAAAAVAALSVHVQQQHVCQLLYSLYCSKSKK